MTNLTKTSSYGGLKAHANHIANLRLEDWFLKDLTRFSMFSAEIPGILLDYSKNRITQETMTLLLSLAKEAELTQKIQALFQGDKINLTENRAALHTALRQGESSPKEVIATLEKMQTLVEKIREGTWLGTTQKPITDIINVGIGGSHLGPEMTTHALREFSHPHLRCHFISNIDRTHTLSILKELNPETSLFIISSKSFQTRETLSHAEYIIHWLKDHLGNNIAPHLFAVTSAKQKAEALGIASDNIFPLWDWVGGRYSIWSAIGLPLAIMIGMDNFKEFLKGAHAIDEHFKNTSFEKNLPVIMALLGIWYHHFFDAHALAILPYADELELFPAYLQQLDMESNGKQVTLDNDLVDYPTGPLVFGSQGCNGQHSFYQWLHQSPHFVPLDFILVGKEDDLLIGSALSQAQAFMLGKKDEKEKYKNVPGNRPSNVIFLEKMTPFHLGQLIALYEHKIFVQGCIWGINSFDQWSVELGKALLPSVLDALKDDKLAQKHDASTQGLIHHYKKLIRRKS